MRKLGRIPRASLIAVLLVVLPLILYAPFVFGGKAIFWGTPLLQFWPWRTYAAQELRAGRLPLWNPQSDFGLAESGAVAGNPDIAGHRYLTPITQGIAIDGRIDVIYFLMQFAHQGPESTNCGPDGA